MVESLQLALHNAWLVRVTICAPRAVSTASHPGATRPPVGRLNLHDAAFLADGRARTTDVALLALREQDVVHFSRESTVTASERGPTGAAAGGTPLSSSSASSCGGG